MSLASKYLLDFTIHPEHMDKNRIKYVKYLEIEEILRKTGHRFLLARGVKDPFGESDIGFQGSP